MQFFFFLIAHLAVPLGLFRRVITIIVVAIAIVAIGAIIARGIVLGVGVATSSASGYLLGEFPGASTLPY